MKTVYLHLVLLLPTVCTAQYKITGKILDKADKAPLPNASVFINNATHGNKTNDAGEFSLTNIKPGQYELIVSMVGYQRYSQAIVISKDVSLPNIELEMQNTLLGEVKITLQPNREKYVNMVKEELVGRSYTAKQCKIINPDIIDVKYNKEDRTLTASTPDFLIIENEALGYRLKYLVNNFIKDDKKRIVYYEGYALFEPLQGDATQQKKWKNNRQFAYAGSTQHFLKSVISGTMDKQGFEVYKLNDQLLTTADFIHPTDQKNMFALQYPDKLMVSFGKYGYEKPKSSSVRNMTVRQILGAKKETILTFIDPAVFFDLNGVITNPAGLKMDGYWAALRLAELLPVDYDPANTEQSL